MNQATQKNVVPSARGFWESTANLQDRIKLARDTGTCIDPKGAWETTVNYRDRIKLARDTGICIPPKSSSETTTDFYRRVNDAYSQAC